MNQDRIITLAAGVFAVAAGVSLFLAGILHPHDGGAHTHIKAYATMAASDNWEIAHWFMLIGFLLLAVTFSLFVDTPRLSRFTTLTAVSRIAMLGALFMAIQSIPHLLVSTEEAQLADGISAPLYAMTRWMEAVGLPLFGLAGAGVALAGIQGRALCGRWMAIIGIIGSLAYGFAGLLSAGFQVGQGAMLFQVGALMSVWLVWSGVSLARAALAGVSERQPAAAMTGVGAEAHQA